MQKETTVSKWYNFVPSGDQFKNIQKMEFENRLRRVIISEEVQPRVIRGQCESPSIF